MVCEQDIQRDFVFKGFARQPEIKMRKFVHGTHCFETHKLVIIDTFAVDW